MMIMIPFLVIFLPIQVRPHKTSSDQVQPSNSQAEEGHNARSLEEARKLYDQADKLRRAYKYDEAIPLAERVLMIRKRVLGPEHPDVAEALDCLALLYSSKSDYAAAQPLYQRALAIREKALGPEDPAVAQTLNHLAILYWQIWDHKQAEALYRRAQAIWEKALGPEHPNVARILHNLASLYYSEGNYAKAEPLLLRALAIWEKLLEPEQLNLACMLNDLANLYNDRGEYAKAESFYRRCLSFREKALGSDHPQVADSLSSFANYYRERGEYAKAEAFYLRALAIRKKVLGPEARDVSDSLHNLALLYAARGQYAKAEPMHQRALAILEKALGPEHPLVADFISGFAALYVRKGESAKAETLYRRALAIWEKAFGPALPATPPITDALNHLAALCAARGDVAQAISLQSRANAISESYLSLNLAAGSERQKMAYLALFSEQTDLTLSLHTRVAPDDPRALQLAFTTLLCRKGRGLEVMTDTIAALRRRAAPQDQELFDQLNEARSRLAALRLRGASAGKSDTVRSNLDQLEDEVENLEARLSARSAEFRTQTKPVTLLAIRSALPVGSVLIEYAVYTPRDLRSGKSRLPRYLAYVLPAQGPPTWVDLGEAAMIDAAVNLWRKALYDPNRADAVQLGRNLDEMVMRPVRSLLRDLPAELSGGVRRLLIAPDGLLNLIPFAALVDERNRYLIERYTISYLTSGRDLLRMQMSLPAKSPPLIVANPAFGRVETISEGKSSESPIGDAWGRIDPNEVFFQSLPGTEREALMIKAIVPEAALMLGEQATETALKRARAPRLLHIATHGFYLGDQDATALEMPDPAVDNQLRNLAQLSKWTAKIEDPLLRSGLALAGVNELRNGDDDGVLTALEAADLDLWGTKLVVLSGCDTGVGEIKNGEGVYGLRRALVLAGSETQVMSLWAVSDLDVRNLMAGYYRRLLKGEGRGEALRQIQLEALKNPRLKHPYYWATFIQAGEWANLDGKR